VGELQVQLAERSCVFFVFWFWKYAWKKFGEICASHKWPQSI